MLSRSVEYNSLQLHGLPPARFLCPWGFSTQEYSSVLPCPPPETWHAYNLILVIKPSLLLLAIGFTCLSPESLRTWGASRGHDFFSNVSISSSTIQSTGRPVRPKSCVYQSEPGGLRKTAHGSDPSANPANSIFKIHARNPISPHSP